MREIRNPLYTKMLEITNDIERYLIENPLDLFSIVDGNVPWGGFDY